MKALQETAVGCCFVELNTCIWTTVLLSSTTKPGFMMEPTVKPLELSFPLPKNPHTILQAHLTFFETSTMLFLTTSTIGESSSTLAPLGSFVYAMPNVSQFQCRSSSDVALLETHMKLILFERESTRRTSSALHSTSQGQALIMPLALRRFLRDAQKRPPMLDAV